MPKNALSIIVLLVTVFLVALGGAVAGNAMSGGGADATSNSGAGRNSVEGPAGQAGPRGETGARGASGEKGPTGAHGAKGDRGEPGTTGASGARGPTGPQGVAGPQGPTGQTGRQGVAGPQGPAGPPGADGNTDIEYDFAWYALNNETAAVAELALDKGDWWIEVDWHASGSGTCKVDGPTWQRSVSPGQTGFLANVVGDGRVSLLCTTTANGFAVGAMLRASRG